MVRFLTVLAASAASLALVVAPVMAQTQTPTPRPAPGAPGAAPAPGVEKPSMKEVEGTVKKVDPAAKSVQVSSGLLGLFGATLEVTDDTKIQVQGKEGASLADIQEGAKVKASYESRDGKNLAKRIEVMPAEEKTSSPAGSPARPLPPAGSPSPAPSGSSAPPPAGQPKTP